jgi:hypothetical protein
MAITISQLVRDVKPSFTPEVTEAFSKAKDANPKLVLEELAPEDKAVLSAWYAKYYGIHVTQVANLRSTISNPTKHLALDLVALMRPEVKDRAGLSKWFS